MSAPSVGWAGRSAALESRRRRRGTNVRRVVVVLAGSAGVGLALRAGAPAPVTAVLAASAAVLALWPSPAGRWSAGAAGERKTARALEGVEDEGYAVLHDVGLPGRRWNLDHVLVGPAGVVIVDSKQWRTPLTVRRRWPKVVEQLVGWQIDAVAAGLRAQGEPDVTVHGFVCVHGVRVRRTWWTGARNAPIGDGAHLRGWLLRLPPAPVDPRGVERRVFERRG